MGKKTRLNSGKKRGRGNGEGTIPKREKAFLRGQRPNKISGKSKGDHHGRQRSTTKLGGKRLGISTGKVQKGKKEG